MLREIRQLCEVVMVNSCKRCLHGVIPVMLGWAQELPACVVHETSARFLGFDCVAGRPQRDICRDCVGLGRPKGLSSGLKNFRDLCGRVPSEDVENLWLNREEVLVPVP